MAKTYRTAQGKSIDIDRLRLKNENTQALGNMSVNARGDQIGPGGRVVRPRDQVINDHYKIDNPNGKRTQNRNTSDDIPTSGGKAKSVENFQPARIESDEALIDKDISSPSENYTISDSKSEQPVVSDTPAEIDKETGLGAGETNIKGGLAKAITKTKDYNEKRGKRGPKRL